LSRQEWLAARQELLVKEKEQTRRRDALNVERRLLPMVRAEQLGGSYYFLDLTALGRQEEWEEPKGRSVNVRGATPDFSS
jgi:predicted dithiol-disulfide oxidoreductase (DUF899 family)